MTLSESVGRHCAFVEEGRQCEFEAVFFPVLWLAANTLSAGKSPIETLAVCAAHKESVTFDSIVNDEGWARIVNGFKLRGLTPPDRKLSWLAWEEF